MRKLRAELPRMPTEAGRREVNLDEWHEQAGRAAYEKFSNGLPLVPWQHIAEDARERWRSVARAVLAEGVIEVRPSPELAEQYTQDENEALRKIALDATNDRAAAFEAAHAHLADYRTVKGQLDALNDALARGEASDGYHTHNELYTYRMLYNALAALAFKAAGWRTVKSWRHSDGKPCFDSPDWFVVHVESPAGQITNHYQRQHWHHFAEIEEVGRAPEWDGHSPEVAALRLEASIEFLRQAFSKHGTCLASTKPIDRTHEDVDHDSSVLTCTLSAGHSGSHICACNVVWQDR